MSQELPKLLDMRARQPLSPSPRRRSLLLLIPFICFSAGALAQVGEAPPLELEERLRLRRELRQAHRMRHSRGTDTPTNRDAFPNDPGEADSRFHGGSNHEAAEVRRRSGQAHGLNEHSTGSGPHGFLLNAEERKHLRRQLREQGGGNRSQGIAPVQGRQHSAP